MAKHPKKRCPRSKGGAHLRARPKTLVAIAKVGTSRNHDELWHLQGDTLNDCPSRSFRKFEEMAEIAEMPAVPKQLQRENAF
jgi:hypothetical protein